MLLDLRGDGPEDLESDVVVAGAGAAGMTIARALVGRGVRVLLLESGGLDYEADIADLNRGSNIGSPYYALEDARLRFFGGTTAIWGGRCAELDRIDFERREWVPHSGWPLSLDDLRPWYDEARALFGLPPAQEAMAGPVLQRLAGPDLAVSHWEFDGQFDRFGAAKNAPLIADEKLVVALHATVREVIPSEGLKTVDHLRIWSPGGKLRRARGKIYVLAAGGLENARILLASNSVVGVGLGNDHDLVGRYFMEHPHARGGRVVSARRWDLLKAFARRRHQGVERAPLLTLSSDAQKRGRVLNSGLTIAARAPAGSSQALGKKAYEIIKHELAPDSRGRALWRAYRRLSRAAGPLVPFNALLRTITRGEELALVIRAEQAPNPDSRVILDDQVDASGMPRIALDWRFSDIDVDSVRALVDATGRALGRNGLGQVDPAKWLSEPGSQWVTDPLVSSHPLGGYHHMGTTRMADDPAKGVTDPYGKVHGLTNLYVAGSSLFPTGGWANPTLTIVALALRSADHIAENVRR